MMTIEQQNTEIFQEIEHIQIDELILKSSNDHQLMLFMSILPGRRIRHDIRQIDDDLNHISVDTIITLNESKELSFMNMTNKNIYNMDIYSMHIKRANIEHIKYPIRDRFIPKSISDYIQFIYSIIMHANHTHRNRILVHCMGGMGRTGMTIVCLELVYEYLMNDIHQQRLIERFCHYPFLLTKFCRVCQAISNVRKSRPGTIHNPLQIMFIHEFYARLKSSSYMQQIKHINENVLLNNHDMN
jgi:protein-tyrosine phosphatase